MLQQIKTKSDICAACFCFTAFAGFIILLAGGMVYKTHYNAYNESIGWRSTVIATTCDLSRRCQSVLRLIDGRECELTRFGTPPMALNATTMVEYINNGVCHLSYCDGDCDYQGAYIAMLVGAGLLGGGILIVAMCASLTYFTDKLINKHANQRVIQPMQSMQPARPIQVETNDTNPPDIIVRQDPVEGQVG